MLRGTQYMRVYVFVSPVLDQSKNGVCKKWKMKKKSKEQCNHI